MAKVAVSARRSRHTRGGRTECARTYRSLRLFNLAMAALHAMQASAVLVLATSFALPVTASFLELDPQTTTLLPRTRTLFELPVAGVVFAFLVVSSVAHLLVSGPLYERYITGLKRQRNIYRWAEYAISASIMIVAIAMLTGIYDVVALLGMFALNASMILFGWLMEVTNAPGRPVKWLPFWFGCAAGAVPWIGIGVYLFGAGSGTPGFVYGIFGSLFVFFNIFAVNMVLQYRKKGRWADYVYGERIYVLLSLVAKSALAWQVFAGTLRP